MSKPAEQSRHFVQVDGRTVHYRRWGHGPAILALHGSPQSSRTMAAFGDRMAARGFCVIAPDTPGNGQSSPLLDLAPDSEAYAAALKRFAEVLGLGRVGLYGFHTGAAVACAFAVLYPAQVSGVFFDGLACWNDEERADCLANYLPPLNPVWDGTHMCWVWSRIEEQVVFFPWHRPVPSARMDYALSAPAHLHANAMDLLDAGDHYRNCYRSAFTFRPEFWVPRLRVDHLIVVTELDVLRDHLRRPGLAAAPSRVVPDAATLHQIAADWLADRPGDVAPEPAAATGRGFFATGHDPIGWRGRLDGTGRPVVLLHRAGGNASDFAGALAQIQGPAVALDLPGHGDSVTGAAPIDTVAALAGIVGQALATAGLSRPIIAGRGIGGLVAAHLAVEGIADRAVTLGTDTPVDPVRGAPSLAPEWDGAHLVRAFRIARRERLFSPWYDGARANAIRPPADLEPGDVQRRALSLLRADLHWRAATAAEAHCDISALLAAAGDRHMTVPVLMDGGGTAAAWVSTLTDDR